MKRPSVLVIDDEKDLLELVRFNLEKNGCEVFTARDGASGLAAAKTAPPDVVILDVMMPGLDGIAVCRELRAAPKTARIPVIMLTARAAEADRVVGLELGADDYVVKPFSPRELAARVKAVLRRASGADARVEVHRVGDILIDAPAHEVTVRGRAVDLTATEFRILEFLVAHPGRVWSRSEILDSVMSRDEAVSDRTVDVHVTALRRKLGRAGELIETVRGFGYKLRDGA